MGRRVEDRSIEFRLEVGQLGQLQNHGNFLEFRFDRESTTYKVEISVSRRFPSSIKYAITPSSDGGPYKRQWNYRESHLRNFRFELRISSGTIPLLKPSSGRRLFQAHWFRLPTPSPLRSGGRGISLLFDS